MTGITAIPLVKTVEEQCKLCYSCVRECPAKAIRISGGQAQVIAGRCIGCGDCVRVCSQNAKTVRNSISAVERLLNDGQRLVALIAPSFPAEFFDISHETLVGMLRRLGFGLVIETAVGADLVSDRYRKLFQSGDEQRYIGTTCPSIVFYIEKYHPALVPNLAPIVSPMVAAARAVRQLHGDDLKTVFIGPCIAKKDEIARPDLAGEIDEVLTFRELRELFAAHGIDPATVTQSEFDPPHGVRGTLYPIGGGLLQASGLNEDLLSMDIVASSGKRQFVQAINEYEIAGHGTRLLELNCCEGCISGSGMSHDTPLFKKRSHISAFAKKRHQDADPERYRQLLADFADLDLTATFCEDSRTAEMPSAEQLSAILRRMGKFEQKDELNCGACGYERCVEHAVAIHRGLAEIDMCLPFAIERLKESTSELSRSYQELVTTKQAMIQSEKLASLGRMASGIAHEINNPLTGVLAYSTVLKESMEGSAAAEDIEVIIHETLRCRKIVKGLLDFARNTSVEMEHGNINDVIRETVSIIQMHMTFHNIDIKLDLSDTVPNSEFDRNQMRSVFNNLAENAAHAMPGGGTLTIATRLASDSSRIRIDVVDTGTGISDENIGKIFDPFFTTKEAGKGTGLGLAVIYGIIEQHGGCIEVVSRLGEGTQFSLHLPLCR